MRHVMSYRSRDRMNTFLINVGIGLATASILALSAVAFTLEYAVSRIANFAHGELLTIGAYAAYSGRTYFHQSIIAAAVMAIAAGTLAGLLLNAVLIEQFRGRNVITVFIATLGASLIIQNLLMIIYGAANVSYGFSQGNLHHVGPFLWTTSDVEVIVSALVIAGLLYLLLQRTKFGKAIRAVSQDRVLAQVSGIPARRIVMQTWGLAGGCGGLPGGALPVTKGALWGCGGVSFSLRSVPACGAGGRCGQPCPRVGRRPPARVW